ncbi:hypothetical protein [Saccharothrix sp. ALI-22-I]|nr:hypothetical protein [Saccharothrix sp. ALI-22-I]
MRSASTLDNRRAAAVAPSSYAQPGTFTVTGQVPDTSLTAQAIVDVKPGG